MEQQLTALENELPGQVVKPGDAIYEGLRRSLFRLGDPAVIVRCKTTDDIARAIAFARTNDLALSVRSGGHSGAGFSTNDGGVVIDLSQINDITVLGDAPQGDGPAGQKIVRIGSGATWGRVADTLAPDGLAISSGDTRSVGVGGLILGGGIGWKVRKYGLALDNLVGAQVVTADGRVLRASAEENPELFWAIRGGGGVFGVVTHFDVVAHPTTDVHFGSITYAPGEVATVLEKWAAYMATAPDDITATVNLMPPFAFGAGPDPTLSLEVCIDSDDTAYAAKALEPLLGFGTVLSNDVKPVPYAKVLMSLGPEDDEGDGGEAAEASEPAEAAEAPAGPPPGFSPLVKSFFAPALSRQLIDALASAGAELGSIALSVRGLGGAYSRVPKDATAFAHRDGEFMVVFVLFGMKADTDAAAPKVDAFIAGLPGASGAYSNFLSTNETADVERVFPAETLTRLAKVKQEYDPGNLFTNGYSVTPA